MSEYCQVVRSSSGIRTLQDGRFGSDPSEPLWRAAAAALAATGAELVRGSLEDLDVLRQAAAAADGVIHTAYNHDFSDIPGAARLDHGPWKL